MKLHTKHFCTVSVTFFRDFSNITKLHYFSFYHRIGKNDIQLTQELNIPRTLVQRGEHLNEHYCRCWLPVSLLKELEEEQTKLKPEKIIIRAQRAQFIESGDEVLFISIGCVLRLKKK